MKLVFKVILFFLLCLIKCLSLNAISPDKRGRDSSEFSIILSKRFHYGFIIIHSRSIREIKDSYPVGVEITISKHLTDEKSWRTCCCYPRQGLYFSYFNFDNPEVLGEGWTLLLFIEPFFGLQHKINFSFRAGAGLTYLTRPYNQITNPKNMSYSTNLNGFLLINTGINFWITRRLNINIAANYNHTSNGGLKEPNKGINFPTLSIGMDYAFQALNIKKRTKEKFNARDIKGIKKDFAVFATSRPIRHGDKAYIISGCVLTFSRQLWQSGAIIAGAEWIINGVIKEEIRRNQDQYYDCQRGGIILGHEFFLGRFILSQGLGFYFYRPYKDSDAIYHRHRLIYKINNRFYVGICLKAHRHIADFLDARIGIYF